MTGRLGLAAMLLFSAALSGCDGSGDGVPDVDASDGGDGADGGDGTAACPGPDYRIVLEDGPDGLRLESAPETVVLTLGRTAYVEVEVRSHHRPIAVQARTLIHTFVNGATAPVPGDAEPFDAGTLTGPSTELRLQTVRLYDHDCTLLFLPDGDTTPLGVPLEVAIAVPPHVALFGNDGTSIGRSPIVDVYGPDCTPCGTPTTEDRECFRSVADRSRCRPWGYRRDDALAPAAVDAAIAVQTLASQVVRDGMNGLFPEEGRIAWEQSDWLYDELKPLVGGHWSMTWSVGPLGAAIWMDYCGERCTNSCDESVRGLFDPTNEFLMGQVGWFIGQQAANRAGQVHFYEIVNEPAAEFWLCGCSEGGAWSAAVCRDNTAACGPNLPVCAWYDPDTGEHGPGPYSDEFVDVYGDLLLRYTETAAEAIEGADPEAVMMTGETDTPSPGGYQGLGAVSRYFIEQGLFGNHPNVVLGVHSYPGLDVRLWLGPEVECLYAGAYNYYLPEGCETAPPLDGTFPAHPGDPPRPVRDLWRAQDEATDLSELLADVSALEDRGAPVRLDDFRMFETELHTGWNETWDGRPSAMTSRARETMAGLRIGAIMAHQGFVGIEFTRAPTDPEAFNLLVGHVSGTTPVHLFDAPRIGSTYDGAVYKLFTRGDEDVIAVWSNAETAVDLQLEPAAGATCFRQVDGVAVEATPAGDLEVATTSWAAPPASIRVESLTQFHFISVVSDRPGFGWLAGITVAPAP